jgi:hypothetical protein
MYIIGIKITVLGGTSLILVLFFNCHYLTWAASFLMHVAGKLDVSSKSFSLVRLLDDIDGPGRIDLALVKVKASVELVQLSCGQLGQL